MIILFIRLTSVEESWVKTKMGENVSSYDEVQAISANLK